MLTRLYTHQFSCSHMSLYATNTSEHIMSTCETCNLRLKFCDLGDFAAATSYAKLEPRFAHWFSKRTHQTNMHKSNYLNTKINGSQNCVVHSAHLYVQYLHTIWICTMLVFAHFYARLYTLVQICLYMFNSSVYIICLGISTPCSLSSININYKFF